MRFYSSLPSRKQQRVPSGAVLLSRWKSIPFVPTTPPPPSPTTFIKSTPSALPTNPSSESKAKVRKRGPSLLTRLSTVNLSQISPKTSANGGNHPSSNNAPIESAQAKRSQEKLWERLKTGNLGHLVDRATPSSTSTLTANPARPAGLLERMNNMRPNSTIFKKDTITASSSSFNKLQKNVKYNGLVKELIKWERNQANLYNSRRLHSLSSFPALSPHSHFSAISSTLAATGPIDSTSTKESITMVAKGRGYEKWVVKQLCDHLSDLDLLHTGKPGDRGIDFRGRWHLSPSKTLHVVGQCKCNQKALAASSIRDFLGCLQREVSGVLGFMVSPQGFGPGARDEWRSSPLPLVLIRIPVLPVVAVSGGASRGGVSQGGGISEFLYNDAALKLGVQPLGINSAISKNNC